MPREVLHHVTLLSNFARAFDKYTLSYSKAGIPESSFPDRFFLLREDELEAGRQKAGRTLARLGNPLDRLIVLSTEVEAGELRLNTRTGIGQYVPRSTIQLSAVSELGKQGVGDPIGFEEAYAASLRALEKPLLPYEALRPLTVASLPIAMACQAKCRFCFSEASVSLEQNPHKPDVEGIARLVALAKQAGAGRFVITGGGEPGLVRHQELCRLMAVGRDHGLRTVLITNGVHLAKLEGGERAERLRDYVASGLDVLNVSRHHHETEANRAIMCIDTRSERIMASCREEGGLGELTLRLICVLQKTGIEDEASLSAYLDWAVERGVRSFCFKELYVSTTLESAYHAQPANVWSRENQVPLALVTAFMKQQGFQVASRLAWGAPVFRGEWRGQPISVAAYTEPSLFWERSTGIARAWNIMANGECLASLEDPRSQVAGTQA